MINQLTREELYQKIADRKAETQEHKDVFKAVMDDILSPLESYTLTNQRMVYELYFPEGKFKNAHFTGEHNDGKISIEIKSEEGFDYFHEIFSSAPPIDYEQINKYIHDVQYLYAFIFGQRVEYSVHSLTDIKESFGWNGNNYVFKAKVKNEGINNHKYFDLSIKYEIDTTTKMIDMYYIFIFRHPKIKESILLTNIFYNMESLKQCVIEEHVAKPLNKSLDQISAADSIIIRMLNY